MSQEKRDPNEMHRQRTYGEYENVLLGLDTSLQYINAHSENPLVLDVGTGAGVAAKTLQKNNPNMRVVGVDRVRHADVEKNLPGRFIQRDASSMPEIQSGSVDGMILVHSIAYAEKNEIGKIAQELARVAKEGALLKGSALHPLAEAKKGLKLTTLEISEALNKNGFICACASDYGKDQGNGEDVFIAIKLGKNDDPDDAEELLRRIIKEN